MIIVYLDWNVLVQIKNGSNHVLKDILSQSKFLVPYSTAHIGDIHSSYSDNIEQQNLIHSDLEFISEFTKNHCLANDGEQVRINDCQPIELFKQRVEEAPIFRNFNLNTITDLFDSVDIPKELKENFENQFKDQPLEKSFLDSIDNPENADFTDTLFPELKENQTMEGYFESFGKLITRLNETEDYKKLRELTRTGIDINRDRLFNSNNPFELINDVLKKFGYDIEKYFPESDNKNAPSWYNQITNLYILLDILGYQEDKIRTSKGRRETFKNTTEDAFHTAFASTCNFYITSDNRSYKKTKKIYQYLKLETLVFKPEEFINYYNTYLFKRDLEVDLEIPIKFLEVCDFKKSINEDNKCQSFHLSYFVFGFFNKIIVCINKSNQIEMITLSQIKPTNKGVTYGFEIIRLTKELYSVFGRDSNNRDQIEIEDLQKDEWKGITWNYENISFRFIKLNGYFQLYFDF